MPYYNLSQPLKYAYECIIVVAFSLRLFQNRDLRLQSNLVQILSKLAHSMAYFWAHVALTSKYLFNHIKGLVLRN